MNHQYEAWNAALAARYFSPELAGRPAYLALDDDELGELAEAAGAPTHSAADHFVSCIRRELRPPALFSPFQRARRAWRAAAAHGYPPYLALLGLCVLAGSRMARDPEAHIEPNAYYPQLNRLLGSPIDAGQPPGFEALAVLWEDLAEWLERDQRGQLGRSTIGTHHFFRHIGWPLSQCLLRAADRHRLPDFFRAVGLETRSEIASGQLWVLLKNWAAAGSGLTEQGRRTIARATDHVAEQITEIAQRELAAWDGELRDRHGRRRGEIVLLLEKWAGGRRVHLRLAARRPDGFPEGEFSLPDGRHLQLRTAAEGWYQPLAVEPSGRLMRQGFSLASNGHTLAYEPAPAVPFRQSLEVSAWLSSRRATVIEEHAILAHASVMPELRDFLRRHAREEWRSLEHAQGNVPTGWIVVEGVHLEQTPERVPPELRRLAPRLNTAAQLEGGLKLGRDLYIVGGEPDLVITIEEGQRCEVEVDGQRSVLSAGFARLPLTGLQPGPHEIKAAGRRLVFTTITGFGEPTTRGTGALGHVLQRNAAYRPTSQIASPLPPGDPPTRTIHLCGAAPRAATHDLPLPDAPPVLLRARVDRHELIGARPGEVLQAQSPEEPPTWLQHIRDAEGRRLSERWQFFDQPLMFAPEWILSWSHLGLTVQRAGESPPIGRARDQAPSEAELAWAQAILTADEVLAAPEHRGAVINGRDRAAWTEYAHLARALLQEAKV